MSHQSALTNRPRGRPPGSGIDDSFHLVAVADMLVADPSVRPTAAIRRAVGKIGPSQLRLLQVKWKTGGAGFLAEALDRAERRAQAAKVCEGGRKAPALGDADLLGNRARAFQDLVILRRPMFPSLSAIAAMERQLEPLRKMAEAMRSRPLEEAMRSFRRMEELMRPAVELTEHYNRLFKPLVCPSPRFRSAMGLCGPGAATD